MGKIPSKKRGGRGADGVCNTRDLYAKNAFYTPRPSGAPLFRELYNKGSFGDKYVKMTSHSKFITYGVPNGS